MPSPLHPEAPEARLNSRPPIEIGRAFSHFETGRVSAFAAESHYCLEGTDSQEIVQPGSIVESFDVTKRAPESARNLFRLLLACASRMLE